MKPLNKQLWYRALDRAVPETYTTLSGEQLGKAIDEYTALVLLECNMALAPFLRDMISRGQACDLINDHFGVE